MKNSEQSPLRDAQENAATSIRLRDAWVKEISSLQDAGRFTDLLSSLRSTGNDLEADRALRFGGGLPNGVPLRELEPILAKFPRSILPERQPLNDDTPESMIVPAIPDSPHIVAPNEQIPLAAETRVTRRRFIQALGAAAVVVGTIGKFHRKDKAPTEKVIESPADIVKNFPHFDDTTVEIISPPHGVPVKRVAIVLGMNEHLMSSDAVHDRAIAPFSSDPVLKASYKVSERSVSHPALNPTKTILRVVTSYDPIVFCENPVDAQSIQAAASWIRQYDIVQSSVTPEVIRNGEGWSPDLERAKALRIAGFKILQSIFGDDVETLFSVSGQGDAMLSFTDSTNLPSHRFRNLIPQDTSAASQKASLPSLASSIDLAMAEGRPDMNDGGKTVVFLCARENISSFTQNLAKRSSEGLAVIKVEKPSSSSGSHIASSTGR